MDDYNQNVTVNISLPNDEEFFKNFAASLPTGYVELLPTGFVNEITLSENNDYFYLNVKANFVHCMSIGYAMLRVYLYDEESNERELLYKFSILNTVCPTMMQFQFEIPAIYFLYRRYNGINITELALSNQTHTMISFMIEWDDLKYQYRIKP